MVSQLQLTANVLRQNIREEDYRLLLETEIFMK